MSDELRYLASLHNAGAAASSLAPFLRNDAGPAPKMGHSSGAGSVTLAPTLPHLPPQTAADAFRAAAAAAALPPPGLPPPPPSMNFFGGPPGLAGPPLDLKHDHLSGALAQGQPMLPPFYYDPCFPSPFPYHDRFGGHLDINGARRKNATRETTAALKSWLFEHRKNPYPTKGEKIFLAIVTKMTLTQVSTWFANARRRLKKENKMTWSPRNRSGEDDDDLDDDDDDVVNNNNNNQTNSSDNRAPRASSALDKERADRPVSSQSSLLLNDSEHSDAEISPRMDNNFHTFDHRIAILPPPSFEKRKLDSSTATAEPVKRPKIWSIADSIAPSSSSSSEAAPVVSAPASTVASVGGAMPFNLTFPPWHNMAAMAAMMAARAPFLPMPGPQMPPSAQFFGGLPPAFVASRNFLSPLMQQQAAFYQPPPPNLSPRVSNGGTTTSAAFDHTAAVSPISSTKSSSPIISKPSIKDATSRPTSPPK